MLYLRSFTFPNEDQEWRYRVFGVARTCYDTIYPFYVLPQTGLGYVTFAPVTIFYGGNGCGKSTALNVIADKLGIRRETPCNRSAFFEDYVKMCDCVLDGPLPPDSSIITSDDVFDFMLNLRAVNRGVENRRNELFDEYNSLKASKAEPFRLRSMDDYETLKKITEARRKTQSAFVRERLPDGARTHSNGESAELYFQAHIHNDALCLLDEPENSLSPEKQMELKKYLEESAHYCGCQLVISTHSPFLLAIEGAKIYNMDEHSKVQKWTQLKNVRTYFEFFEARRDSFMDDDF